MSDDYKKLLNLEEEIGELLEKGVIETDTRIIKLVSKVKPLLKKISNYELINFFAYDSPFHHVMKVADYFKKFKYNKKELTENSSYKEEFIKLNEFGLKVREVSLSEEEYVYICLKCDIDAAANYLLKNMSNEEIMELSKESTDWEYKLFLFGNLKA